MVIFKPKFEYNICKFRNISNYIQEKIAPVRLRAKGSRFIRVIRGLLLFQQPHQGREITATVPLPCQGRGITATVPLP